MFKKLSSIMLSQDRTKSLYLVQLVSNQKLVNNSTNNK